jgi:hypothetical protein
MTKLLVPVACVLSLVASYRGVAAPLDQPALFAPGVISTGGFETHPAFAPDGRAVYFVKSTPGFTSWTICVSRLVNGKWAAPEVAPFSGQYSDADPFITADGAHLYFISTRPLEPGGAAKDLDIWVMDRSATGWGAPRRLPEPVNSSASEWFPTIAANGTIYFGSDRPGGQGRNDLYRARLTQGQYASENLGAAVNSATNEFEPLIAPDESFLIFMGGGRAGGRGGTDLWVTYNQSGTWTAPVGLGDGVNSPASEYSPAFSPDRTRFFWGSTRETIETGQRRVTYKELNERLSSPGNGLGDIYEMDATALHLQPPAPVQAPATSPPLKAGERYKSVQVLRDIPADQIIPSMAFIANSLGVTCSHCHGAEWVSDEKPAKQRAREMLRLTESINRDQFAGRAIVTCQTCHDGRVIPADTPRVEDAGWARKPAPAAAALPAAADVLARYLRASGGETALQALKNRSVTGTVTRFNGRSDPVSGPFELFQQGTSASLRTQLSHPPEADAEINASLVRPLLTQRYTEARTVGHEIVRGREAVIVTARNARGAEQRLFFDDATGLLVRRTSEVATPLGRLPERFDLDDYRLVEGIMVPHTIEWARADYQVTFRFEKVAHNVEPPK